MWHALLGDLVLKTPKPVISARFHLWLAHSVAAITQKLTRRNASGTPAFSTVALTGGCFQNRILFEEVYHRLEALNFTVITHSHVPANDGGLALGQAAIGAAWLIRTQLQGEGKA
jgi:hydrogenase maturation protein HypF